MKPMLPWYTLNEAADWMSEITGERFRIIDLLAAGLSDCLKMKFQVPSGATFWERIGHEQMLTSPGRVLALEFSYIDVLMERGNVNISSIDGDDNPGASFRDPKRPTSTFRFDPHINIDVVDVRIDGADLAMYAFTLILGAGNDETPGERAKRLLGLVNEEKAKGNRHFNKTVAEKEGISTTRLNQILNPKAKPNSQGLGIALHKTSAKRRKP